MVHLPRSNPIFFVPVLLSLAGCESWLLKPDTVDIASTVAPIYLDQTLDNLARMKHHKFLMPSLVDIGNGTVTVNGSITPSATIPFGNTVVRGASETITTVTDPYRSLTLGAGLTRSGSWTVTAVTDAVRIQNIAALYKYAIFGDATELVKDYRLPSSWNGSAFVVSLSYLTSPFCVFCLESELVPAFLATNKIKSDAVPEALIKQVAYISPLLAHKDAWLAFSSETPPPEATLGKHDGEYISVKSDTDKQYLLNFILFTLPTPSASGASSVPRPSP